MCESSEKDVKEMYEDRVMIPPLVSSRAKSNQTNYLCFLLLLVSEPSAMPIRV
jgi:hypothetical protein